MQFVKNYDAYTNCIDVFFDFSSQCFWSFSFVYEKTLFITFF